MGTVKFQEKVNKRNIIKGNVLKLNKRKIIISKQKEKVKSKQRENKQEIT